MLTRMSDSKDIPGWLRLTRGPDNPPPRSQIQSYNSILTRTGLDSAGVSKTAQDPRISGPQTPPSPQTGTLDAQKSGVPKLPEEIYGKKNSTLETLAVNARAEMAGDRNLPLELILDSDLQHYTHPKLSKYPPQIQRFIRVLALTGVVARAAKAAKVHRTSMYRMRDSDPDFAELWYDCQTYRDEAMEDEAFRRAVYGVTEAVYHQGRIVGYRQVKSDTLLLKMLEAAKPEKYRQNHKIEIDGQVGLVPTLVIPSDMSEDEWDKKFKAKEEPEVIEGELDD